MYKIDFKKPIHIHFIGIGGISMSGLAQILLQENFTVSGSDSKESSLTKSLRNKGAKIIIGQSANNITEDIDLVVYTAAISNDNPELMASISRNIPILTRAQLLGQIMRNYRKAIAVSGTHGKTTTTSMISHVLLSANTDPTISVGGILPLINGNIRVGQSDTFITEACEYTNSFLHFYPTIGIILNVDADHLDFFSGIEEIKESFRKFAMLIPEDGYLIINKDTYGYYDIIKGLKCKVLSYGIENEADYNAKSITFDENGFGSFDLYIKGEYFDRFELRVPGIHNVSNSLSALALSCISKLPVDKVKKGLLSFRGTDRRFQYKGNYKGVTIVDDYAHHPTEIEATLTCAKKTDHKEVWCIFQPHTYTRTKALMNDFAKALSLSDHVVLADIYAAREKNTCNVSSKDLLNLLKAKEVDAYYFPSFHEIENFVKKSCTQGDLLITMGAGDVVNIGENILK